MKKIILSTCLLCTTLFSSELEKDKIDKSKESITLKYTNDIFEALEIADSIKEYTVYIRSIELLEGESAFVIYIVNIPPNKLKVSLQTIQNKFEDAFRTSKNKVKLFTKNQFKNNSFIYSSKVNFPEEFKIKTVSKKDKISEKSANKRYLEAKEMFNNKKYKEAINVLEKLSDNNAANVGVNFYLGRSYYETKSYEKASAAFERVNLKDSDNLRAKLELSQSYLMLGLYSEAADGFNEVLKNNIPLKVKENITKKLEYIKSLEQKGFFYGSAKFGSTYDTNSNSVSKLSEFIRPNGIQNNNEDIYGDSSYYINLNMIYNYQLNDNYSFNNSLNLTRQYYDKDDQRKDDKAAKGITAESKKETDFASYSLNLSRYFKSSVLSLSSSIAELNVGGKGYLDIYGLNISYQKRYLSSISFFSSFGISKKLYNQENNKNLNSNTYQLTIGQSTPTNDYGIFNFIYFNTNEHRIKKDINAPDKSTNGLMIGNVYNITDKLSSNLSGLYSNIKEKTADATYKYRKDEIMSMLSFGLSYKFDKTLSINSNIKKIDNESNIEDFSYGKTVYDLNFEKRF